MLLQALGGVRNPEVPPPWPRPWQPAADVAEEGELVRTIKPPAKGMSSAEDVRAFFGMAGGRTGIHYSES